MSDFFKGYWAAWIVATITVIVMSIILSGCAHPMTEIVTTPSSWRGWESTMKVVAKSDWVVTFCLLAFFSGVIATAMDAKKIGISIIFASIMTLFLGLAVHRFPTWMAVIGFIGSAGACVMVVLKRKKALIEIIKGVQNYRDKRYALDSFDNDLRREQSSSTKNIVKKVKKCLRKKEEKENNNEL